MPHRAMIEHQLRETERRVANGRSVVARQRMIVAELEVGGCNAAPARALLETSQEIQAMLEAGRDRLRVELVLRAAKRSLLH